MDRSMKPTMLANSRTLDDTGYITSDPLSCHLPHHATPSLRSSTNPCALARWGKLRSYALLLNYCSPKWAPVPVHATKHQTYKIF